MSMSQCTTFILNGGREEIKIFWDLTNGEFSISRIKLPDLMGDGESDEEKCSNEDCPHQNHTKHSFYFRAKELNVMESLELSQIIQRALFMLLGLKDKAEVQEALGFARSVDDDDDDCDDDDD